MKARGVAALLMLAGVAGAACGASEDVVYQASEVRTPTTPPPTTTTSTTTTLPTTSTPATTVPQTPIVIERLWSPANALAELTGTGATTDDPVTVDGESATVVSFDSEDDGSFTATVRIDEEGAHTVRSRGVRTGLCTRCRR